MELGKHIIENPLVLGPMAGVTDWAFRTVYTASAWLFRFP